MKSPNFEKAVKGKNFDVYEGYFIFGGYFGWDDCEGYIL